MSNPQERQAGTSGSTMGYEQGQARGQEYEGQQAGRSEVERGLTGATRRLAVAVASTVARWSHSPQSAGP